jgi:hypothetical protein
MENQNQAWGAIIAASKDIDELVRKFRKQIGQSNSTKADAVFETSAEVLLGMKKAFDDFLKHEERAWRS